MFGESVRPPAGGVVPARASAQPIGAPMRKAALFALVCSPVVSAQVVEESFFTSSTFTQNWGIDVASLGDLDGNGIVDLAVSDLNERVFVVFLGPEGVKLSQVEIRTGLNGFTGQIDSGDNFGGSLASLGDRDGDGWPELAVGATGDDDAALNAGAVWVLHLGGDGHVLSHHKITTGQGGFSDPLLANERFGTALAAGADLDGDGFGDLAVTSNRSSLVDRVWLLFLDAGGSVLDTSRITNGSGGFGGTIGESDDFGASLAMLGDVDGNGHGDLAAGVPGFSGGGLVHGGVWVLFLDGQGGVIDEKLVRSTTTVPWPLGDALAPLGDLDGNGTPDFVSSLADDGEVCMVFLDPTGAVVDLVKIFSGHGGFQTVLNNTEWGAALASDDLDGDGRLDWIVGSTGTTGAAGKVWILRGSPKPFVQASPEVFDALIPGTTRALTLEGKGYGPLSTVSIDGVPVEASRVTVESSTRLRVDLPQLPTLGEHEVSVAPDGGAAPGFDVIEIVAPAGPVLQIANGVVGAPLANIVYSNEGLSVIASGPVGQTHYVLYSDSQLPSVVPGLVSLGMGNAFTSLDLAVVLSIPAAGWIQTTLALPNVTAFWNFQSVTLDVGRPIPVSNLQQALVIPL